MIFLPLPRTSSPSISRITVITLLPPQPLSIPTHCYRYIVIFFNHFPVSIRTPFHSICPHIDTSHLSDQMTFLSCFLLRFISPKTCHLLRAFSDYTSALDKIRQLQKSLLHELEKPVITLAITETESTAVILLISTFDSSPLSETGDFIGQE